MFAPLLAATTNVMAQVTRFKGGEVCSDAGVLEMGDVWVREGTIIDPMDLFYEERRAPDLTVDCRGLIVAPGFIDIQINGVYIFKCAVMRKK